MAEDDLIAQWARAVGPFDPAAVSALFTEDGIYDDVPVGKISNGRLEREKHHRANVDMVPDHRLVDVSGFLAGTSAAVQWTMAGTLGRDETSEFATASSVRGVSMLELREGSISRCTDYWDLATMLRQLGLPMPSQETLTSAGDSE